MSSKSIFPNDESKFWRWVQSNFIEITIWRRSLSYKTGKNWFWIEQKFLPRHLGSSHDPTTSQQQAAFEQSAAAAQQAAQAAFLQQQAQNQQSQPQMNQVPIPPHKVEFNVRHTLCYI